MTNPVRWGFLGASRIGRRALLPAITAAGHRLHAVAARDLGRAEAFAREAMGQQAHHPGARAYGDYAALLADPAVDAVYIALTNDAHLPWTLRALQAGKHVLCEKPLALCAAEVAQMQDAERRSGRLVLEAFAYRFTPQVLRLVEVMRARRLGRVVSAHVSFCATMPDGDFRWTASLGGGALFDIGCYCVSLLRMALAEEPRRISAFQQERDGVDATLAGLLEFGNGALGQFSCSFAAARSQHLVIAGSDAALALDWPFAPREPATLRVADAVEHFEPCDPYQAMVEHFAGAMQGHTALRYGLADSLYQARTLDALFTAAREGRPAAVS